MKKLIEEYTHTGQGYNPFLIREKWQIAQLNYEPAYAPDALRKLDVHHKTDEAFILLQGEAVLIAASINGKGVELELSKMKPNVLYNIPKGCWHNIALWKGAKVLIIEDENTHLGDFEFYYLDEEEREKLRQLIIST
jgi:mannose-6-phosphate isomerase-like protein (cupin superfamily)